MARGGVRVSRSHRSVDLAPVLPARRGVWPLAVLAAAGLVSGSLAAQPTPTGGGRGGAGVVDTGGLAAARPAPACRAIVLVYHHISDPWPTATPAERGMIIPPLAFEQQLRHLSQDGYAVIPYGQLVDCLTAGTPLPPKAVVLTFDDGLSSQYRVALPLLERYGQTATFFIPTAFIGAGSILMTWDQVRDLRRRGMAIGSHSHRHPDLRPLSADQLRHELTESKRILEARLGEPVHYFAHPFGALNARTLSATQAAGYRSARGIDPGKAQRPGDLYRVRITYVSADLATFQRQLQAP